MKKLFAIVLAMVMLFAMTVAVSAEEVIFTLAQCEGQDNQGTALADYVLAGVFYTDKYITNWKNGTVWDELLAALAVEGAVVRVGFEGEVTAVGYQTSTTERAEVEGVAADGVLTVDAAALLAVATPAIDGMEWGNFYVIGTAGSIVKSIEVVTGAEAPADEAPADETPADEAPADEAPADETPETEAPAETGVALAVIPAIVAMAAVVISKKR